MLLTTKITPPKRDLDREVKKWATIIKQELIFNGFTKEVAERIACSGARNMNSVAQPLQLPISLHLVPKDNDWAVVSQSGKHIHFIDQDYYLALAEARVLAKKNKLKLVLHAQDGWAKDCESFQVNRPFFSEN